ncbi:hypothetical protein ANN_24332 [Periplaneta americana]|uniref:Uncharacterized protein n=1 Tax=Periplaneta americana TaxID=6978 RepID=A0ABQ8S311_PERAM|nr:hypothetical protein ANN_24332 [Periplaneta americana]
MDLREVGYDDRDWINLAQDREQWRAYARAAVNLLKSQCGPIPWPPRSPDLTPLDFFLWGDVKCFVYETPIDSAEDLVARVVEAAHVIRNNVGLFERCRHSIVRRYQFCNAFNERHTSALAIADSEAESCSTYSELNLKEFALSSFKSFPGKNSDVNYPPIGCPGGGYWGRTCHDETQRREEKKMDNNMDKNMEKIDEKIDKKADCSVLYEHSTRLRHAESLPPFNTTIQILQPQYFVSALTDSVMQ